jgi:hypothetical protein
VKTLLFVVLQLAASGSDAYYTDRFMSSRYGSEGNPLARPFVQTRTDRVLYFSGQTGLKLGAVYLLKKRGHGKLAESVAIAGIADNAVATAYSATH